MPIFRRSQAEIREAGGRASGLTVLDPRRTMDREMETRQLAEIGEIAGFRLEHLLAHGRELEVQGAQL